MSRRLNVNINQQTEAALLQVAAEMGTTVTDALRVLVGMGISAYRWDRDGFKLYTEKGSLRERITWVGVR
ncbi:hypothetical protein [Mycolicibacterium mageritense]|uniref:hypothetical protein n=1 Tax=Mycolicibacterium mageritense TaxID=53462 RepID=UPI001E536BD1|nr:hypothetical protein [Mycolicibacterium mageritense]GJJ22323.1 hypothetical protein MTY414_59960 [Mycolicibacterium mageritense]